MRCFFNLARNGDILADEDGVEVSTLNEMMREAEIAISELAMDEPASSAEWGGWRLEVTDHAGHSLFVVELDEICNATSSSGKLQLRPPVWSVGQTSADPSSAVN